TGESVPGNKNADFLCHEKCAPADRKNMIFSSTTVIAGNCTAIITETGMNTQVGRIAHLLASEDAPQTPLQIRLAKVGKALAVASLGICIMVFLLGIIRQSGILNSFMLSVSLAVAAIPEGLPATVTVILSLGVQLMSKNKAIIRHLPAVETLGAATVICSDKTGTLTQNKMTVTHLKNALGEVDFKSEEGKNILTVGCICNNASVIQRGRKISFAGDPTETAIVAAAYDCGEKKKSIDEGYPRLHENPFSGERKLMSTLNIHNGKHYLFVKGAPDTLLAKCTSYSVYGRVQPMSERIKNSVSTLNEEMARDALRVIAVAYREAENENDVSEAKLTFAGLIGMTDPPRPEAARAVSVCKRAGITPVMITGDHIVTACAVAQKLGIADKSTKAMNGKELDSLDDASLQAAVADCSVFARVTPEHKVRIVKAFRARGEIVAMTGDGVNDAPALKAADIGCAMGKSGTDVAKNAADMILVDDNFATIIKAVEQGRGIYDNIKKAVHFLLSTNIGEILAVFASSLLGFSAPLVPIQLLWVNLVTDSLPAMALGTEKPEKDIMSRKPLSPSKGFFSDGLWLDITLEGLLVGTLTLLAFSLGALVFPSADNLALGRTMAFCTLSFC
ncbi:MAG: cation-translocating P-type ATPase, partial [Clostridia bacterium]|nr:cation-translocating P-type ATPase [Clostridia bacterium]